MKQRLLFCLLLSALTLHTAFGQTSQGFSSQTQPVITFQTAYLRETLRDSLLHGKLPVITADKATIDKAAIDKAATDKATIDKAAIDKAATDKATIDKAAVDKKTLTAIIPGIVVQTTDDNTKEVAAPIGQVDIAASSRILAIYDNVASSWESNKKLTWWLPQVIADGDFNKLSGNNDQAAPKAGTIGVDAVRMKALYRKYTYTGKDATTGQNLPNLTGYRNVFSPRLTFTMLFTLFGQGTPLSTGLKAGAAKTDRATREVTRSFGQTLLAPGGLSQSGNSGLLGVTWLPWPADESVLSQFSLDATLQYSHTDWSTRDSATSVNILAPSIGLSFRVFDRYLTSSSNQPQVRLFARYALRHIFGDIESQPRLLLDVFNSTQRTYRGVELGATASISAVRVTISGGLFNGDIEGFSHGQMLYGLGLAAGIRL